ncbi:MAG: hypothetical protein CML42_07975 [Rhodobacteraceae bacterium]|nr:hypothetical protein [Paracoccaceae bacterium]|tara:strand:- start:15658 stop:16707 length:1050 start_codon:yes stop_codon:yes gene_type:complete
MTSNTRISQRAAANGASQMFNGIPTYKWETASESLDYIFTQWQKKLFDFNPSHQRGEALHNKIWESDIVKSIIQGLPLGHPEFDTVQKPTGALIRRSLDGKQRFMAILRYMNNKYKYKLSEPACMKGKYFKDLTLREQNHIKQIKFHYIFTETQLPNEIVSEWFCKKQVSQKTSQGERLNSLTPSSKLIKLLHVYNNNNNISELFGADKRYKSLECSSRLIYGFYAYTKNLKIDPKFSTIHLYMQKYREIDISVWNYFQKNLDCIYNILDKSESKNKYSKSFMLPILYMMSELKKNQETNIQEKLIKFINTIIDTNEKFYDDVGGSHNATKTRCEHILQKYNEYSNKET